MSSIIKAKDLCLWYGTSQALKNINIEIPEKSITAVGYLTRNFNTWDKVVHTI